MWQSAHIMGVGRVIKRARALARDATRLPVVVLVEIRAPSDSGSPAHPGELVTRGAKFGGLRAH